MSDPGRWISSSQNGMRNESTGAPWRPASAQKRRTVSAPWRNASGVAAVAGHTAVRALARPADPDGRARALERHGRGDQPVETMAPRLDLRLGIRPHLLEELERLVGEAPALLEGHAERGELAL